VGGGGGGGREVGGASEHTAPDFDAPHYCTWENTTVHASLQGAAPGANVGSVTRTPGAPFVVAGAHCTAPNPSSVAVVASPDTGMARLRAPCAGQAVKMAFTLPPGLSVYHVAAAVSFCARQGLVPYMAGPLTLSQAPKPRRRSAKMASMVPSCEGPTLMSALPPRATVPITVCTTSETVK